MKAVQFVIPVLLALAGGVALYAWVQTSPAGVEARLPVVEGNIERSAMGATQFTPGRGSPGKADGAWTMFRGAAHDNVWTDPPPLAETWPADGPPKLWTVAMGEGPLHRRVPLTPLAENRALAPIGALPWPGRACLWLRRPGVLRIATNRSRVIDFTRV